jgi:hypothetical protein
MLFIILLSCSTGIKSTKESAINTDAQKRYKLLNIFTTNETELLAYARSENYSKLGISGIYYFFENICNINIRSYDLNEYLFLAKNISENIGSMIIFCENLDDEVLILNIYRNGNLILHINSNPKYFIEKYMPKDFDYTYSNDPIIEYSDIFIEEYISVSISDLNNLISGKEKAAEMQNRIYELLDLPINNIIQKYYEINNINDKEKRYIEKAYKIKFKTIYFGLPIMAGPPFSTTETVLYYYTH